VSVPHLGLLPHDAATHRRGVSIARDLFRSVSDMVQRRQAAPEHLPTVAVLVLPDVVPFDLVIPDFIFGDPKPHGGVLYYRMLLCGVTPGLVPMVRGIPVGVSHGLEVLGEADTIVIPGRSPADTPLPDGVAEALRAAADRGARLVSICTGSFVLAAAGLLDGRRATTHWAHADNFSRKYPKVSVDARVLYVEDGPVLTSAGMAAGIDLCLHVVRSDHGAEVANAIARRMVVPPHRTGGQAQFIEQPVPVTRDETLQRTQAWALERLHEPLTVEQLAEHSNMSPRHFARRFQSELGTAPLRWLLAERVRLAQRLLEQTDLPVQRIAEKAGFGSAIALRRHFTREVGTTPLEYRLVFRGVKPGPQGRVG
jgi:transcriptional regulator GlxA family with amidase domain